MRRDARRGLAATPKSLPPRWLYDDVGSELFERITQVPEYYPTRREKAILDTYAADIAAVSEADTLVELGAGTSEKTTVLLDALAARGSLRRFAPFDVAEATLSETAQRMVARYRGLAVEAVVGDFTEHLDHLPRGGRRLIVFLGGTIGNLGPTERSSLLTTVASGMRPGDTFLVGTDLVKDRTRLIQAYDDAEGVTAAFNKNVLAVLNRRLGAAFRAELFDHVAYYDDDEHRIEMRLRARTAQRVPVAGLGLEVQFEAGEYLLTEISTKFTEAQIGAELTAAGMTVVRTYTDPAADFAVSLAAV
ncbi:MAG: L-histidine N(alpha)-methyltransferase [Acidobacteriota bacterium]|nr:L-histidine N(alpha)-methyltransferase [Acidobacteriota bacterium]